RVDRILLAWTAAAAAVVGAAPVSADLVIQPQCRVGDRQSGSEAIAGACVPVAAAHFAKGADLGRHKSR
ncbi:MAG: hypothetical protein ACXWUN_00955, partial [Allosphingosinicella sp.]